MTRRHKWTLVLGAAGAGVAAVAIVAVAAGRDPASRLDEARNLAANDERFETAEDAGLTFVKISRVLLDAGEECTAEQGEGERRCAALFATSGFAQVAAVHVVRCTHPGIFRTRAVVRAHLDDVAAAVEDSDGELVPAPQLPDCG